MCIYPFKHAPEAKVSYTSVSVSLSQLNMLFLISSTTSRSLYITTDTLHDLTESKGDRWWFGGRNQLTYFTYWEALNKMRGRITFTSSKSFSVSTPRLHFVCVC